MNNSRSDLYFALSECYKEPTETFAGDVAQGILYQVVADGFRDLEIVAELEALHIAGTPKAVWQGLKRAYYPLFVIPPRFVLPVESVFKEWTGENDFLAGERGMIMGAPALDMLRRYQARGIVIPPHLKDHPDHLALLLEYGGLLHEANDLEELAAFAAAHLDGWIEEFAEQVHSRTTNPFYQVVVAATVAFIQAERRYLALIAHGGLDA